MKTSTIILAMSVAAFANAVNFDFESSAEGIYSNGTVFSNGGIDLTLAAEGGSIHLTSLAGSGLNKSVVGSSGSSLGTNPFQPLVHTFSTDIQSATFLYGDGGGDNDGTAFLQLFDSNNNLINTLSAFRGSVAGAQSFVINQTFRSARFTTNASFNAHSLFQEWSDVQAVPEPATLTILSLGALVALKRKKK